MFAAWPYKCTARSHAFWGDLLFNLRGIEVEASGFAVGEHGRPPQRVAPQAVAMNVLTGRMTSSFREMRATRAPGGCLPYRAHTVAETGAMLGAEIFLEFRDGFASMKDEFSRTAPIAASISGLIE